MILKQALQVIMELESKVKEFRQPSTTHQRLMPRNSQEEQKSVDFGSTSSGVNDYSNFSNSHLSVRKLFPYKNLIEIYLLFEFVEKGYG